MIYLYNLQELCKTCKSYVEVVRFFGLHENGKSNRLVRKKLNYLGLDLPSYAPNQGKKLYKVIQKHCPVCEELFDTQEGHKKEKTVCSVGCANTYFRTGQNHPNWLSGGNKDRYNIGSKKYTGYRATCFMNHNKECVVKGCDEKFAIDVHHMDGNHRNDSPENLIPLCKNHHFYWHFSEEDKELIEDSVKEYISKWSDENPKR